MKNNLKGTNLAGMSTTRERVQDDYYATPNCATEMLLDNVKFYGNFLEKGESGRLTPLRRGTLIPRNDTGGASRFFLNIDDEEYVPFLYCTKPTKKEKGDYCSHITVKPKRLIKWLIKLVTPIDGKSLDITAGSGTHGLSCEELNREENYNIEWVNIEMMNTADEPYFDIAKRRIEESIKIEK